MMAVWFKFLFLLLAQSAWAEIPLFFPPDHCSVSWSGFRESDFLFDFKSDTVMHSLSLKTDDGINYQNYRSRMSKQGLIRRECHKSWTVLIYMMATSELEPYAYADLNEMEANLPAGVIQSASYSGSSLRTDVIVQLQFENEAQIRRLHIFSHPDKTFTPFTKSKLAHLTENQIHSPVISILDRPQHSNHAKELEEFLKWSIEEYPSEHYLLILWGHGQFSKLSLDSSGNFISLDNLRSSLQKFQDWTGDRLDILAADACYWMAVDDIEQIADCTHYSSGSSDLESAVGYPYGDLLRELNSGRFMEAPNQEYKDEILNSESYCLAWTIPELYQASFAPGYGSQSHLDPIAGSRLTGCSVQSNHLKRSLLPALNRLGLALVSFIDENPESWIDFKGIIEGGFSYRNTTQDLGYFLKNIADYLIQVKNESQELISTKTLNELNSAIKLTYHALNYSIIHSAI